MKNMMWLIAIMIFSFIVITFAQVDGTDPPNQQLVAQTGINQYFTSISALAILVIVITELLKAKLFMNSTKGWVIQGATWAISIGLAFIGWWLKLGIFADVNILTVISYGIGVGLISNGLFDIPVIKNLFNERKLSA